MSAAGGFHEVQAAGIRLLLDLSVGHIRTLEIDIGGRRIAPLYTAPWVDDPAIQADDSVPPNLKRLSGDFFCAPFGGADEEGVPSHGWPANSRWRHVETQPHIMGGAIARFALAQPVQGARLLKELTLRDGHPFVYQRHVFEGGSGKITAASHPMTKFSAAGRLSFSPKAYAETPPNPLEPDASRGRYALAYPARFDDLGKAPLKNGGATDLTRYPIAERHEDFVMLVEAPGSRLGWAAAAREDCRDVLISLKNPRDYPVTMLWFSNGGRDYPPWNGRNVGVLGIEEGRTFSANGYAASIAENALSRSGVPTSLALRQDGSAELRHVIGGLPLADGWRGIAGVEPAADALTLVDIGGSRASFPYDAAFLA
jgi:hypothetical protein